MNEDLRDQLAEQAWGVLVEAGLEGVTDPNLIAHAIVRNQLPLVEAHIKAVAGQRTAEALELAAVLTVPSQDTAAEVREALLRRADTLRAEESHVDEPTNSEHEHVWLDISTHDDRPMVREMCTTCGEERVVPQ